MGRWACTGCGTVYAARLFRCPRCHTTTFVEDGKMPKITRHGGASIAGADAGVSEGVSAPVTIIEPVEPLVEPVAEPAPVEAEGDEPEGEGDVPVAPLPTALKADWVAYAVALGRDEAEAAALTKAELVAAYGG